MSGRARRWKGMQLMPNVRRLGGAEHEYPAWRRWMRAIGTTRERYYILTGRDPLAISEATTVGLMLSAAGQANLIGLLEYPTKKRAAVLGWCYGRCDLWLLAPRHSDTEGWAFEVKHRRLTSRSTPTMLTSPVRAAWKDAGALDVAEASMRLACTVFYSQSELAAGSDARTTLERLASRSDWAWRISHDRDLPPVYFLFRRRCRGNKA